MAKRSVSGRKATRAAQGRSVDEFFRMAGAEGSLAHRLSKRPGGIEGVLERAKTASAAGVLPAVALRQELAGERQTERVSPADLPPREVIEKRLAAACERIWQVQGVCGLAAKAAYSEECGAEGFATEVWCAMEGAERALGEITGMLDSVEILRAPKEGEEEAQS